MRCNQCNAVVAKTAEVCKKCGRDPQVTVVSDEPSASSLVSELATGEDAARAQKSGAAASRTFCGSCGSSEPISAHFCSSCGRSLQGDKDVIAAIAGRRLPVRVLTIATVIAVLVGAATLGALHYVGGQVKERHTISGAIALTDSEFSNDYYSRGDDCEGSDGYDDITEGADVQVLNQAGTTIATGSLDAGAIDIARDYDGTCEFKFSIPNVPKASFFKFEVSHRGQISFSYAEMKAKDWNVGLTLG